MPLGVREVLLVVRAQNMSSGVLRGIAGDFQNLDKESKTAAQVAMQRGQSLMALGAGIGALGAAGLLFLGKATSSAVEYNRQVALTKTQMFGVKASFDQVAQAGLDVASKIAVPLDQIQSGLYDIFSSMDVNLTQAKFLLTNFSKEAVAGQVDLSTAEKASIGILNAYGLKVKDVTKIQDTMFNMVKYGVGTYGDFANAIGRVTGPAVRDNQTFAQTAALMAFTTRNGLSAANAASSVGRALDAIGKARDSIQGVGQVVVSVLGDATAKKLGITAKTMIKMTDAAGRLLPINQIMTELGTTLKGLNPTQLNDVMTAMFKGNGGTIQAMRFLDIAVKNYKQLNTITKEMGQSKGALQAAYNIMANTPAMQIQLLKNNFHVLMIEIGDVLLPVLNKFVIILKDMFMWIGKIPKPVIVIGTIFVAVTSILLTLAGVVLLVVGAWTVLSTILEASEIALAPILGIAGLVVLAIVALAAAAYFIVKYWGPISTWFHNMWFDMYHWIDKIWGDIWKSMSGWWDHIKQIFLNIEHWVAANFDKWWTTHGEALKKVWGAVWFYIGGELKVAWDLMQGVLKVSTAIFMAVLKIFLAGIEFDFKLGWAIVTTVFKVAIALLNGLWRMWFVYLEAIGKIAWATIRFIFKTAWDILVGLFSIFLDLMTGHWHQALVDIESLGKQIWNNIRQYLSSVWSALATLARQLGGIIASTWDGVWHSVESGAKSVWGDILHYLKGVWGEIESGTRSVVSGLGIIWKGIEVAFKTPVNWLIQYVYDDGIKALWNTVMGAIGLSKWDLPNVKTFSSGGRLGGWGGGDVVPALLEPGEAVVDKHRTKKYAALFGMMGVPGFAGGGIIGNAIDVGKMMLAASTGNSTAFVNALTGMSGGNSGAAGHLAGMVATLPVALMKHVVGAVWHAITKGAKTSTASGGGGGVAGPGGGNAAQNMKLAQQLMPAWGFGPIWTDWQMLWNRESGWNQMAYNASSGATGIPQSLPYTKMPRAAWLPSQGGSANVHAQETWGIGYIQGRYGNPANAWDHEIAFGWYDNGGPLHPGYTLAYNGTGKDEHVSTSKGGPNQNFYITTQEINPRRHAAELGFELARRSG